LTNHENNLNYPLIYFPNHKTYQVNNLIYFETRLIPINKGGIIVIDQ